VQLYFIRHGQSANNALWAETRSNQGRNQDPELTAIGQEQAQFVARFLSRNGSPDRYDLYDPKNTAGFGITHLYCSPMVRAVATATRIAEALSLPLVAWKDLHETGGIFLEDPDTKERVGLPGKERSYFAERYPALILSADLAEVVTPKPVPQPPPDDERLTLPPEERRAFLHAAGATRRTRGLSPRETAALLDEVQAS